MEIMEKMMEIAMSQIHIGKPDNQPVSAPKGEKIPSNSGDSDPSGKVVLYLL